MDQGNLKTLTLCHCMFTRRSYALSTPKFLALGSSSRRGRSESSRSLWVSSYLGSRASDNLNRHLACSVFISTFRRSVRIIASLRRLLVMVSEGTSFRYGYHGHDGLTLPPLDCLGQVLHKPIRYMQAALNGPFRRSHEVCFSEVIFALMFI